MGIRDEIKFDAEDKENLLDPRICRGEDVVSCIMRYLGVDNRIIENPTAEEYLRDVMEQILERRSPELIEILNGEKEPELWQNEKIAKIIKSGTNAKYEFIFMTDDSTFTLDSQYSKLSYIEDVDYIPPVPSSSMYDDVFENWKRKYGEKEPSYQHDRRLNLDTENKENTAKRPSNKAVQLKVNDKGNVTMMVYDADTDRKEEKIIYTDVQGNPVIMVRETTGKEPNSILHITTTVFDRYGIEMKKVEDGVKITERLPKYPFAARQIYFEDEKRFLPELNTEYIILSDCANLQGGEITFNNIEELEAYYNEHRTEIAHKILRGAKTTAGVTRRGANQINLRLKALGYQTGIIGNGEVTRN